LTPLHLLARWKFYSRRYGALHAISSYLGRLSPTFWRVVGRRATFPYLRRWLREASPRIINLGGGSNCITGCLTVDTDPRADVYVDITAILPFPSSSLDAIFCEEAIEHIDEGCASTLLAECIRTLKPGGFIRVTTPDLDYFLRRALEGEPDADSELNDIFRKHGHRHLYTRHALADAVSRVGFTNVRFSSYRDPGSKCGYLDSHADRFMHSPEISMYLEAEKPEFWGSSSTE
jgi:predicted SAM-dependent methyltransferase